MAPTSPSRPKSTLKGKGRMNTSGDGDLFPLLTYRHIHGQNLGVHNPMRVIALCDNDAFYASCERVRLSIDPEQPLVVQQWTNLIAVNYPARKFGITRHESITEARKKCPNLMAVHVATYKEGDGEPQYWDDPSPTTHKVSLDHYRRESSRVFQLFQDMMPAGGEMDNDDASRSRTPPVASEPASDTIEPPEIGSDAPLTWHDVALSIAAELMRDIRQATFEKLGYTLSAGIARNKMLAKLSASYRKPMAQSVLRNAAIPGYLGPMPFQKIRFLGGKLGDAIATQFGATTVSELREIELEDMQRRCGEESIWVWNVLRITYPTLHTPGSNTPRSKQIAFPFTRTFSAATILVPAEKLWRMLLPGTGDLSVGVINVALGFAGLDALEAGQKGIEGFFSAKGSNSSAKKTVLSINGPTTTKSERLASEKGARRTTSPGPKDSKHQGKEQSSKLKRDFFSGATSNKRKIEVHEVLDDSSSDVVEISPPPTAKRMNSGSSGGSGARTSTPTPVSRDASLKQRRSNSNDKDKDKAKSKKNGKAVSGGTANLSNFFASRSEDVNAKAKGKK
ncbi:DNA polymerase eta subunit [Rhizoctonia solani AG-1 IB]|uniref:DNA polymerase eta subunit n=1 Tax=Thanatephorus cucumeris (strain AG1-IB / isolate 7/3/14) TaxID=1108050 RepID=M5BRW5_THACB|nr:DNA polymerase eta subunit [Rhizoctonia solani AG-1 IB]